LLAAIFFSSKYTSTTSKIKNHESSSSNRNNHEQQSVWLCKKQATNHSVVTQYNTSDTAGTKNGDRENFSSCNETTYKFLPQLIKQTKTHH